MSGSVQWKIDGYSVAVEKSAKMFSLWVDKDKKKQKDLMTSLWGLAACLQWNLNTLTTLSVQTDYQVFLWSEGAFNMYKHLAEARSDSQMRNPVSNHTGTLHNSHSLLLTTRSLSLSFFLSALHVSGSVSALHPTHLHPLLLDFIHLLIL